MVTWCWPEASKHGGEGRGEEATKGRVGSVAQMGLGKGETTETRKDADL